MSDQDKHDEPPADPQPLFMERQMGGGSRVAKDHDTDEVKGRKDIDRGTTGCDPSSSP